LFSKRKNAAACIQENKDYIRPLISFHTGSLLSCFSGFCFDYKPEIVTFVTSFLVDLLVQLINAITLYLSFSTEELVCITLLSHFNTENI